MRAEFVSGLTDWLLTYWVHATVLLAIAAVLTRLRAMSFAARDLLWKCALIGPLFSASAHSFVLSLPSDRLEVAPVVAAATARAPLAVSARPQGSTRRQPNRRKPRRHLATGGPSSWWPGPGLPRSCCSGSWRDAPGSCAVSAAGAR